MQFFVSILLPVLALLSAAEATPKYSSSSVFQKKIKSPVALSLLRPQNRDNRIASKLSRHCYSFLLDYRGGGGDEEEEEDESETDSEDDDTTEIETNENVIVGDDNNDDDYESEESEDYTDEDDEEEEEDDEIADILMKKSSKKETNFVDPYFISPSLQIYTTFGTILLSRKIDMFSPKVVRLIRFFFILQIAVQQAFILYVRIMAKRENDRTHIELKNPITSMVESQLESGGGNDMVKNLASSFLKKESTVREYDISQTSTMQGSILFNMILMWFLHFKMQQVQPLLVSVVNGFMQLVYNPLFQVYIMGRNLERPFKSPEVFKPPMTTTDTSDTTTVGTEDGTDDEMTAVTDEKNVSEEEDEEWSETEISDDDPQENQNGSDDDDDDDDDNDE